MTMEQEEGNQIQPFFFCFRILLDYFIWITAFILASLKSCCQTSLFVTNETLLKLQSHLVILEMQLSCCLVVLGSSYLFLGFNLIFSFTCFGQENWSCKYNLLYLITCPSDLQWTFHSHIKEKEVAWLSLNSIILLTSTLQSFQLFSLYIFLLVYHSWNSVMLFSTWILCFKSI